VRGKISGLSSVSQGKIGRLAALRDPQIGQSLALIHHQPEELWSVHTLASRVGLSRSAFSAKFKQLTGKFPMQYLTRVRLTKVAGLLRTHSATLLQVAQSIGYGSEVAFDKVFKRSYEMAPGTYRQRRPGASDGKAGSE
jgi:transcriptional regulator GlxA family with amidase domain